MTDSKIEIEDAIHPETFEALGGDMSVYKRAKSLEQQAEESGLGVDFWLNFPIEVRPLKFVPGRNRKEKRTFRALAAQQERGTITRTKPGRGGNMAKLDRLFAVLARAGVVRLSKQGEKA